MSSSHRNLTTQRHYITVIKHSVYSVVSLKAFSVRTTTTSKHQSNLKSHVKMFNSRVRTTLDIAVTQRTQQRATSADECMALPAVLLILAQLIDLQHTKKPIQSQNQEILIITPIIWLEMRGATEAANYSHAYTTVKCRKHYVHSAMADIMHVSSKILLKMLQKPYTEEHFCCFHWLLNQPTYLPTPNE